MYHVFEALDELVDIVEEARSVPMTASCVVPRQDTLLLLDDVRDALPGELDDAQDVLDKRDQIIGDADEYAQKTIAAADTTAEQTVTTARQDADRMVADAKDRADRMVSDADQHCEQIVAEARAEAERMLHEAQREYDSVTARAQAEAARLVARGNEAYDKAVSDGRAEQTRLVSEQVVVANAKAEAERIVDTAHTESDRLRGECDVYVDTKFAEFEDSLNATLREVVAGRRTLRSRSGVSEYPLSNEEYGNHAATVDDYDGGFPGDYPDDYR